jgi:acyl carrier protein
MIDTQKQLFQAVSEATGHDVRSLTLQTSLRADLGMDSLELVDFGMELESRFNIDLDFATLVSIGDVLEALEESSYGTVSHDAELSNG